ncbi:MAG: hypothetical protein AB1758_10370, partial [Candidatus Eremiobacterota bacterium]
MKWRPWVLHLLGLAILVLLLARMPLSTLGEAIAKVGWSAFVVFAVEPVACLLDAASMGVLLGRPASFRSLYATEIVAHAMSRLIPVLGLGGEPYRVHALSRWAALPQATQVMVEYKLAHSSTGLFWTALTALGAVLVVPLPTGWKSGLAVLAAVSTLLGAGVAAFGLSALPVRTLRFLMRRFKVDAPPA